MTFSKDTGLFEDNYDAEIVLTDIDMQQESILSSIKLKCQENQSQVCSITQQSHRENCGDIKVQTSWEYATFPVAIYI